jgi:trimeric autotransporter adhesin
MFQALKTVIAPVFFIFLCMPVAYAQSAYKVTPQSSNEECRKGAASVQLTGLQTTDSYTITWSTGQTNVFSLSELSGGDYSVKVQVKTIGDTTNTMKLDTTIQFKIEKEECLVVFNNHFTPNGDNYNDSWAGSKTEYYPNFQLFVFNKWGQQVHSQKGSYTPWDGKWNGINVPDGTYYYIFYYDGGSGKHIKGDVTILR